MNGPEQRGDGVATTVPPDTDVLVVGAGPVGLSLGAALATAGVDHLVVERLPGAAPGAKAAGIQPRTLEYLEALGVADDLVAAGVRGDGFALHDGDRTLVRLSYDVLDSPYPFLLLLGQHATEEILQRRARAVGTRILRRHRFLDWTADFPGVTATVAGPDGLVRAVRSRYVVGADGLHSAVRERAGIAFGGSSPSALYALADVRFDAPPPGTDTTFFVGPEGLLLVSPLPGGLHRVVAAVAPGSASPTSTDVEALLRARGGGPLRGCRVRDMVSASTYHVQQRVAERLVDGPVALLGDAAHTHSPAGGQGMNTGIQDSANLAWRLTEILRHGADPATLAGYHAERHPVADGLIAFTAQLTALTTLKDPTAAALRNTVLEAVAGDPGVTGWITGQLSELAVGYAPAGPGPTPGRRLSPLLLGSRPTTPSWVLADPGAARPERRGRLLVAPAPALSTTALLRPDGYVAAVDLDADAAAAGLDRP